MNSAIAGVHTLVQKEQTLVAQAISGSRSAFGYLAMTHERDLYAVCYCMLHNPADCADAVQEALLKAYAGIGKLREARYFKTWLTRIVINECKLLLHKRMREQAAISDVSPAVPAHEPSHTAALIAALPQKQRLVLVLYYEQGYKVEEIARILRIPPGTVKSRAHAARMALRTQLEKEEQ